MVWIQDSVKCLHNLFHQLADGILNYYYQQQLRCNTLGMLKSDPGLTFIFTFVVAEIGCKTD